MPGDPKDKTAALLPEQKLHIKILQADVEKVFWFRKVSDFLRCLIAGNMIPARSTVSLRR